MSPTQASTDRDLVFHTSGTESGLQTCLGLCRAEGSIVELSWYGNQPVSVKLGAEFHVKRLTIRASQVGTVSPHARPRYTHRERLALALALCADDALDVLFEGDISFDDLPAAMPGILGKSSQVLCQRVRY